MTLIIKKLTYDSFTDYVILVMDNLTVCRPFEREVKSVTNDY